MEIFITCRTGICSFCVQLVRTLAAIALYLAVCNGAYADPMGQAPPSANGGASAPAAAATPPAVDPSTSSEVPHPVASDYKLDAADRVRVIVFNEPTLSAEFVIGDSGLLSFPLIGDVQARGRTPANLARDIEKKLADGYFVSPRVSIDVLTYRPFYILGEVVKAGEYPYSTKLTVFNAVAQAEGFTFRANRKKVFIRKAGEQAEHEYKISPDLMVNPGDTIRIAERYF